MTSLDKVVRRDGTLKHVSTELYYESQCGEGMKQVLADVRRSKNTVHSADLLSCTGLTDGVAFAEFLLFLRETKVWHVSLGDIRLSHEQLEQLLKTLQHSNVTHFFYDSEEDEFRKKCLEVLEHNCGKHDTWNLQRAYDMRDDDLASIITSTIDTFTWVGSTAKTVNDGAHELKQAEVDAGFSGINRCVECNQDMGDCNPRQYCCKTYCGMQSVVKNKKRQRKV